MCRGKGEPGSVRLGKTRILYYVVMNEGAAFVLFLTGCIVKELHCRGRIVSGSRETMKYNTEKACTAVHDTHSLC